VNRRATPPARFSQVAAKPGLCVGPGEATLRRLARGASPGVETNLETLRSETGSI
jgi:hypothetical protein